MKKILKSFPSEWLDKSCVEEHLLKLTDHFSEWTNIATYLGLTAVQQKDIENDWPRNHQRQRKEMFKKWKEAPKKSSTYRYTRSKYVYLDN